MGGENCPLSSGASAIAIHPFYQQLQTVSLYHTAPPISFVPVQGLPRMGMRPEAHTNDRGQATRLVSMLYERGGAAVFSC